jgi:uncharacterized protein (DUF4415 family)
MPGWQRNDGENFMKKKTNVIDPRWQPTKKWKPVERRARHEMPAQALEPRNIKVRVNMYLDLDVVEFFKKRALQAGASPYQTQINAELRRIIEEAQASKLDPVAALRQASRLINKATGQIEKKRSA